MIHSAELMDAIMDPTIKSKKPIPWLHWTQRPQAIKNAIDAAYENICNIKNSQWGMFNGNTGYSLCGIVDELIIEKLILQQLNNGQKDFIFMDIGAGNFQWGRHVAEFLNQHPLFKDKITVTIYGLRGECNDEVVMKQQGVCTLYEYGKFKIENLIDELIKYGHNLCNKIDLIVSAWCFRHLVDPVGTLLQVYELLKLNTGMVFIDGFFLETTEQRMEENCYHHIYKLFASFEAQVFMSYDNSCRRLNCFAMQKSTIKPYIPLIYSDARHIGNTWQIGSEKVITFSADVTWQVSCHLESCSIDNYFLLSKDSAQFFQQQTNYAETIKMKQQKFIELLTQAERITIEKQLDDCVTNIVTLAQNLIDLKQDSLESIVNIVLAKDIKLASLILNFSTGKARSLLTQAISACIDKKVASPLFKKLIYIVTPETLNAVDAFSCTLLMLAIKNKATEIIAELLFLSQLDLQVTNRHGKTALDIVKAKIVELDQKIKDLSKEKSEMQPIQDYDFIIELEKDIDRIEKEIVQFQTIEGLLLSTLATKQQNIMTTGPAIVPVFEIRTEKQKNGKIKQDQQQVVQAKLPIFFDL